ncbi:MAG TPA: HAMP domain-containing sensor histidine kinase [Polyangiaceae bacterium]
MRTPRFVAEIGSPAHREQLRAGIATGYMTVLGFLALGALAHVTGVLAFQRAFFVPLAVKLVANTLAWISLRTDRGVLATAGLNVLADMFAMTALIYFTGGEQSHLFPIYLIEITVLALLGNVGITVCGAIVAVAMYGTMAVLVARGVLAYYPQPAALAWPMSARVIAVDVVYTAFVLGVPTYYTARILQDLREKQHALEERTQALVEAGRQKSQFMANVTHELRTPIHGICGLSDLVESGIYGPVSPKQRDAQQSIKRSARSLLALIDDLLQLARADAAQLSLVPESVDVAELVATVAAAARWMVGIKNLTLETEVEPGVPPAYADPRGLKQVLLNLLSNAAKFTPEGGRIVVRARAEGESAVRIEVQDSGIGIAPEDQERIFEDFLQLDGSAERAYGGVGLGLAVVRRLTEAMNARVDVKSAKGAGATFAVSVPRRAAPVSAVTPSAAPKPPAAAAVAGASEKSPESVRSRTA